VRSAEAVQPLLCSDGCGRAAAGNRGRCIVCRRKAKSQTNAAYHRKGDVVTMRFDDPPEPDDPDDVSRATPEGRLWLYAIEGAIRNYVEHDAQSLSWRMARAFLFDDDSKLHTVGPILGFDVEVLQSRAKSLRGRSRPL